MKEYQTLGKQALLNTKVQHCPLVSQPLMSLLNYVLTGYSWVINSTEINLYRTCFGVRAMRIILEVSGMKLFSLN